MIRLIALMTLALTLMSSAAAAPSVPLPPPPRAVVATVAGGGCAALSWRQASNAPAVRVSAGTAQQERPGAATHALTVCGYAPGDLVTITEVWPDPAGAWAEVYQFHPMTVHLPAL